MIEEQVIQRTAEWTIWWLGERQKKLREHMSETMSVNPFLLPIIYDLHSLSEIEELFELTIGSHLMTGHNTGFGKLIDEKILPNVFNTTKLDARFRRETTPYSLSCFDEIDHIVYRTSGDIDLLSLKAGKWTIQLSMAVQLNKAFSEILERFPGEYNQISVGVFYGKKEGLTDKYDILRGINRGKNHDVVNLQEHVNVYAGREFWAWLNDGELLTQDWVLSGIRKGLKDSGSREESKELLDAFKQEIVDNYGKYIKTDGDIDWEQLLIDVNG
ncbi:MAG: restriction endonuclease [Deltaproteobacteria bacterium]|nr:restriction endonuclease [Deltaproteobacteria bacterium]